MANKQLANKQASPPQPSNRGQLITYCIIFVVGFLAGVGFTIYKSSSITPVPAAVTATQGQQAVPHNEETHQAIIKLEGEVTANPGNFQAWTSLGNLYYDTDQAVKAIAAYNKALALHKGDANLLTDLGVMYRKNKQPDKAIESFNLAIRENPAHLPSKYNKGIVLLYDLNDKQGALASWEEMLGVDPQAKTNSGMSIRELIDSVKADKTTTK
jgi:cytochrome c-type biogenesis protein CcmH/NrfG